MSPKIRAQSGLGLVSQKPDAVGLSCHFKSLFDFSELANGTAGKLGFEVMLVSTEFPAVFQGLEKAETEHRLFLV